MYSTIAGLEKHHYTMLSQESGISDAVIAARGYSTATTKRQLEALGFSRAQQRVPALVLPLWDVRGTIGLHQIRPDTPRHGTNGRAIKYETPRKAHMLLDVPPLQPNRLWLQDPSIPLWITEGLKKGDCLVTHGCCAVALLGVWNWRGTNSAGGKTVLADFEAIALNDRIVYLVFDSDVMTKSEVHKALERLGAFLASRKAQVRYVYVPPGPGATKVGADDFLVHGGTLTDLRALATPTLHPVPSSGTPQVPYQATPEGLVWLKPTSDGQSIIALTNFAAIIVADIAEDDGAETRRLFELEARRNGQTARCTIPAAYFHGMAWVSEHLGASAIVMPGIGLKDHARAAIQMLSQGGVQERRVYTHTGWRDIAGAWCYLHAGGALGAQGAVPGIDVALPDALARYQLPAPPDGAAARAAIRASLRVLDVAPAPVAIPLYSALWRAVLGRVDCSLHLSGPTGQGKSTLAALVQQHYGAQMTYKTLPASWISTGNTLAELAFQAKDVVLTVDDFCPAGSQAESQRMHRDADRLFRAQGNHSGRGRMRPDGSLRPVKPPRTFLLSTGEDIPQGQSVRARMLILEVSPGMVQWDTMTACQQDADAGIYAQALAGFVRWLAPRYSDIAQGLYAEMVALRQQALQGPHRRTPEIIANLALGMQYFLAYAQDHNALSEAECHTLWDRAWQALGEAGAAQQEHQTSEEPVGRFLALLTGALAAGQAHVADARTLHKPRHDPAHWGWREHTLGTGVYQRQEWQPLGTCVGWLDGARLYLEPEAAFSVVQKLADTQKAPMCTTQQVLWKRMHEHGLLVRDPSQNKNVVKRTIGAERRYVLEVAASLCTVS